MGKHRRHRGPASHATSTTRLSQADQESVAIHLMHVLMFLSRQSPAVKNSGDYDRITFSKRYCDGGRRGASESGTRPAPSPRSRDNVR